MKMNMPFSLVSVNEIFHLYVQTQQATPDTSSYMIAGFVVIFGAMLVYLVSLVIRWRNLQGDLEMLRELEKSQHSPLSSASKVENRPVKQVKS